MGNRHEKLIDPTELEAMGRMMAKKDHPASGHSPDNIPTRAILRNGLIAIAATIAFGRIGQATVNLLDRLQEPSVTQPINTP